jgi:hypothetical protein
MKWLINLFSAPTVASVTSQFTKVLEDLAKVAEVHRAHADRLDDEAEQLQAIVDAKYDEANAAEAEATEADRLQAKFRKAFGL